jgi:hypothetical protein
MVACGALAAPSRGAGAPEAFLLRVRTQVFAASLCDRSTTETLVFRDGLVVESERRERGVIVLRRSRASSAAMADLASALTRDRVGFERGGCAVEAPAEPGRFYEFAIDWFGEAGRRNSFSLTSAGDGAPCREETAGVFEATQRALTSARAAAGAQTAQVEFAPSVFCEHAAPGAD